MMFSPTRTKYIRGISKTNIILDGYRKLYQNIYYGNYGLPEMEPSLNKD